MKCSQSSDAGCLMIVSHPYVLAIRADYSVSDWTVREVCDVRSPVTACVFVVMISRMTSALDTYLYTCAIFGKSACMRS